MENMKEEEMN